MSRRKLLSHAILILLLVSAFPLLVHVSSENVSAAPDTHTWDGGGADAFAGTHLNWVSNIAPTALDSVIFDAGALPCTWNLSIALNAFSMLVGYTGTVTQATDFSCTSFIGGGGTLTGSAAFVMTDSGNWARGVTTFTTLTSGLLRLTMSGVGVTLGSSGNVFHTLTISGAVTIPSGSVHMNNLDVTGTVSISSGADLSWRTGTYSNAGTITGLGTLRFMVSDFDYAFALGTITCGLLEFQQVNYDAVGRKFTLIEALSTTADLLVSSDHATATYTLDLSAFNYALTAKTITIGTRGILTGRASTITSSGNVDFSAGQFNKNTSTLIMTGAGKTIKTANTNGAPYNLQVSGTISTLSSLNVTNNLTIDASKSLTMGTGKTLTVGGNMSVGSGGAMTLQDNLYTVNPLINNGAITQNNKWFNVSSSSATPLTGYGTFDGNLGLNGSLASSYQVQTGLPMGNLYTDRDTQISLDSTRYLRAAPASTEFVGVSVKSYGSESGYLARFDGTSTGPVTYTLVGSPNELYDVWVDHTTRVSVVQASSDGTIQFTYNGPFSSHEFIVSKSSGPPVNLQASFSYSIDGSTVSFTDKSYGGVTEYLWDFGDGTGSTAQNPSHRYTKAGDYTVSLTVYDSKGHSSTAKTTITLELGPDFPIERTPKGWNIWVSDQAIISAPAVAFLAFGIWMLASVRFQPLMPFLSPKLKKILGIILLVVAIYWYGFIDNNWFGG